MIQFENVHLPAGMNYGLRYYHLPAGEHLEVNSHFHMMFECMWFEQVSGTLVVNQQQHALSAGTLVFVPSLVAHEIQTAHAESAFFLLQFESGFYRDLALSDAEAPGLSVLAASLNEPECSYVSNMLHWLVSMEASPHSSALKKSLFKTLLIFISTRQKSVWPQTTSVTVAASARLEPVLKAFNERSGFYPNLDEAAELCGMSRYHFSRVFKRELGENFVEYVQKRKITAAVSLLAHSTMSISNIAYECQFADTAYFCAKFRRYMHLSPGEFRRQSIATKEFV